MSKKVRATHLQLTEVALLNLWADRLRRFVKKEHLIGVYLCGSSLVSKDYRDVDVRIVVTDEAASKFDAILDRRLLGLALSHEGQKVTSLPIDCQVQSLTEAGVEAKTAPTSRPLGSDRDRE